MPALGVFWKMGCAASQPNIKNTVCEDYGLKKAKIDSVVTVNTDTIPHHFMNANENHNNEPPPTETTQESNVQINKKTHQKQVVTSTPLMHNTKNASQSQTDFFKMLDAKIEKGHDAYSETSVT
ncbi:uncharacterized protein [Antedon mediterranea]|uniref:uncharacterized protein n=1 Tax=Antedon mediterranea TaxID=105859 RepID=UPI003AF5F590